MFLRLAWKDDQPSYETYIYFKASVCTACRYALTYDIGYSPLQYSSNSKEDLVWLEMGTRGMVIINGMHCSLLRSLLLRTSPPISMLFESPTTLSNSWGEEQKMEPRHSWAPTKDIILREQMMISRFDDLILGLWGAFESQRIWLDSLLFGVYLPLHHFSFGKKISGVTYAAHIHRKYFPRTPLHSFLGHYFGLVQIKFFRLACMDDQPKLEETL